VAGFYATGHGAGRDLGDFLTSPEVGPLFGAVLARALDAWWGDLGRPDPFVVVEAGAGTGALAASILAATPACSGALRYVLVERSARLRAEQQARLPVADPAQVLGPGQPAPEEDEEEEHEEEEEAPPTGPSGTGPLVTVLADLPAGPLTGVVLANELLDNQPFRILERRGRGWFEVRVGAGAGQPSEEVPFEEVLVPAAPDLAAEADRLVPDTPAVPEGAGLTARIPLQRPAAAWLRDALGVLGRGRVVAFDYTATTPQLAGRPWTSWVRTYRGHGRGGPPLEGPGEQDITCELAVDQLARIRSPATDRTQAEFLGAHGIESLVDEARAAWQARAHLGDLDAMRHRSRLSEAAALTDPAGLGGFHVLEWDAG
jgi:SAM-dependent MidA family methyltransferase